MAANTKAYVVDSSYALAFLLPDEKNEVVAATFNDFINQKINLLSTLLLPFEVHNSLKTAVLRKRITESQAIELSQRFTELFLQSQKIKFSSCLELSIKHDLTFYDASYLQLALDTNLPLLTLDKRLQKLI